MNTKLRILFSVAFVIAAIVWYGYKQYVRRNSDLAYATPDVQITSADLIGAFETNEKLANQKFLDKIIAVTGKIKDINKDEKGYYTVVLGEASAMSSVRCSMDTSHTQDLALIKPENRVTIRAACTGFNSDELLGSDVILNRGVVVNKINY
jgi:putative nucleic acid binding protein